jgi:hypothetical protein
MGLASYISSFWQSMQELGAPHTKSLAGLLKQILCNGEVLGQRVPANVEVTRDSALGPLLHQSQAVNLVDLFWAEHCQPLYKRGGDKRP